MKKSICIAAGFMISMAACAQKLKEADVPLRVKEAFASHYKEAKGVKWEKEGANFEAEFEIGETEQSVLLDEGGNVLENETEIKVDELPAMVKEYVAKNYKGAKIKEAARISSSTGLVTYEAEIKGRDLIFDSTGKFIKEELDSRRDKD